MRISYGKPPAPEANSEFVGLSVECIVPIAENYECDKIWTDPDLLLEIKYVRSPDVFVSALELCRLCPFIDPERLQDLYIFVHISVSTRYCEIRRQRILPLELCPMQILH